MQRFSFLQQRSPKRNGGGVTAQSAGATAASDDEFGCAAFLDNYLDTYRFLMVMKSYQKVALQGEIEL